MDAVLEPNGKTLLDNSLVLWISEFGDGGAHSTNNLPVVLAAVLFATILVIAGNLLADLGLAFVDPRLRLGRTASR